MGIREFLDHWEVLEFLPSPAAIIDQQGRCLFANQALAELLLTTREKLSGWKWFRHVDPTTRESLAEVIRSLDPEQPQSIRLSANPAMGEMHLDCFVNPFKNGLAMVSMFNVSGYRWQEEQLVRTQRFNERLVSLSPALHVLVDLPDFAIQWVADDVLDVFGMSSREVKALGGAVWDCLTTDPVPFRPDAGALSEFKVGERFRSEFTALGADGQLHWFSCLGEVYEVERGVPSQVLLAITDITSEKEFEATVEQYMLQASEQNIALEMARDHLSEANEQLELLTLTDPLTKALNRRGFDQAMERSIQHATRYDRPLSLVAIDLDHFKKVNDTHGHAVGDEVLQATAKVLHEQVRETDIFARLGGEEFFVILPETSESDAHMVAERYRQGIGLMRTSAGPVTASLGVTQLRRGESAADFIERADQALYHAKHSGRNQVSLAA